MQLYIKRITVYTVVGNVDIHTLYACDSPLKYHVSHFKTLKFVSMRKALKNTDLSKTCMCVSLTEFEVCTWVTDQGFSVQIYGPMQGRSKCACHKSEGKTSFCNLQEGPGKRGFSTILSYLWVQTERKDFNSRRYLNLAGRVVKNGLPKLTNHNACTNIVIW